MRNPKAKRIVQTITYLPHFITMAVYAQLIKLAQRQRMASLAFENGGFSVVMDAADLLGGDLGKLAALAAQGECPLDEDALGRDFESIALETPGALELMGVYLEVRLEPAALEEGGMACEFSVWLRRADEALEVSALIPSLAVGAGVNDEDRAGFAAGHAIACREASGEWRALESALRTMPAESLADTAERFEVRFANGDRRWNSTQMRQSPQSGKLCCKPSGWAQAHTESAHSKADGIKARGKRGCRKKPASLSYFNLSYWAMDGKAPVL